MSEGRELARSGDGEGEETPPPRKVSIGPQDVFQPGQVPPSRWRERSFFAPILLVVLISAALVYGVLAAFGVLWRMLH